MIRIHYLLLLSVGQPYYYLYLNFLDFPLIFSLNFSAFFLSTAANPTLLVESFSFFVAREKNEERRPKNEGKIRGRDLLRLLQRNDG